MSDYGMASIEVTLKGDKVNIYIMIYDNVNPFIPTQIPKED